MYFTIFGSQCMVQVLQTMHVVYSTWVYIVHNYNSIIIIRWTINLALTTFSKIVRVQSLIDSEDLYEVMVRDTCMSLHMYVCIYLHLYTSIVCVFV